MPPPRPRATIAPRALANNTPFVCPADRIQVCLITSRATGRWIIPKGWLQQGLAPHELAALEAYEEAGLKGQIGTESIGRFRYPKLLEDGSSVRCDVGVCPMQVDYQTLDWPERTQRNLLRVKLKPAAKLVDEPELSSLLRRFDPHTAPLLKTALLKTALLKTALLKTA